MKYLRVSVSVNALGVESGWGDKMPLSDLEDGSTIRIDAMLPSQYGPYVAPIYAKMNDDKTAVEVTSEKYGNDTLPLNDKYHSWKSPEIGLSYATCQISVFLSTF